MAMTEITIAHLPPSISVFAALFTNVTNAAFLRAQLLAGNEAFEYAFIDPRLILSPTHVLAAVFRAANDALNGRLKSRNVHSEIVFDLSPNNNIAESFRRFGIAEESTTILAIKVIDAENRIGSRGGDADLTPNLTIATVQEHLLANVHGDMVPLLQESLSAVTDIDAIKKVYKLNSDNKGSGKGSKGHGQTPIEVGRDSNREELEVAVLAMMALKGF